MNGVLRDATVSSLWVAGIQLAISVVPAAGSLLNPNRDLRSQLSYACAAFLLVLLATLIGGAVCALQLKRKEAASLSDCALGGAVVGLLSNLIGQTLFSVFLLVSAALPRFGVIDGMTWTFSLGLILLNLVIMGTAGIVLGGIGGGLVGVMAASDRGDKGLQVDSLG